MALRKGNRWCTHHPISQVLSYCTLSPYYRALVFAISNRKGDILLRVYLTWLATEPVPAQSVFSKPSLVPCTCNPEQQKCFSLNLTFTLPACRQSSIISKKECFTFYTAGTPLSCSLRFWTSKAAQTRPRASAWPEKRPLLRRSFLLVEPDLRPHWI